MSLRRDAGTHAWELGILRYDHPTVPEGYAERSRGVIINVEVADASAEYERIVRGAAARAVRELRDEEFGQRHFIVVDPAGNLVDVIENIAPSDEFAAAYVDAER